MPLHKHLSRGITKSQHHLMSHYSGGPLSLLGNGDSGRAGYGQVFSYMLTTLGWSALQALLFSLMVLPHAQLINIVLLVTGQTGWTD